MMVFQYFTISHIRYIAE